MSLFRRKPTHEEIAELASACARDFPREYYHNIPSQYYYDTCNWLFSETLLSTDPYPEQMINVMLGSENLKLTARRILRGLDTRPKWMKFLW